jgi:hypothetical protein
MDNVRIVLMHVASKAVQSCMIVLGLGGSLPGGEHHLAGPKAFTLITSAIRWTNHLLGRAAE